MRIHNYFVYILTDITNKTLYVGVTNNLKRRICEHKTKSHKGFTARNNCTKLVYYEHYQWIKEAISREKQLKGGSRSKKLQLIKNTNPEWVDLSGCFVVPLRHD